MKFETFLEVRKSARAFANATERGCRKADKKVEDFTADWVRCNCSKRNANSRFIVYTKSYNYGTRKYSDYKRVVEYIEFAPDEIRETEKSYIITTKNYKTIIRKDYVLGWLS